MKNGAVAAVSRLDARIVQAAVARKGVHLCVGLPAILLGLGLLLHSQFEFLSAPIASEEALRLVGYCLVGVAISDVTVGFVLKRRKLFSANMKAKILARPGAYADVIAEELLPLLLLAAAPAGYGLIFYFLGGDLDTYVLLSVCCPAGLMIIKPREDEIERLDREIFGEEVSD